VVGDTTTVQDIYQKIKVPELETQQQQEMTTSQLPSMPGAGISRSLYQQLYDSKVNVVLFSMFVLEGGKL
jgi:hypothetical protein